MMMVLAILLSLLSLVIAPTFAGKALGLKGGLGKGALVGLVSLGLMQIAGLVAQFLGPLGDMLGLLGGIAAWFQVVKVVHGTDTAKTVVFMFWHLFFLLLMSSLLALFLGTGSVTWMWRG
ncbi:MAG: hypothetical protein Q8O67_05255 [Deltaproteobacteria bacterium]|nr:hypothetical protein [Deltaproteobacteria bacterium]